MINLQEAFSKLNMMESSEFELLDDTEKDAMKNFLDQDDEAEAEPMEVIDPQAEEESDIEDSYVGKIIVQCPVCKSLLYRTEAEIEGADEEEQCPYCFSVEKFDIIGKVVPMEDETAPEVIPEEQPEGEAESEVAQGIEEGKDCCPECGKNPCICEKKMDECDLKEDLESISIETEDQVINVSAEDKCEGCEDKEEAAPEEEAAVELSPEDTEEHEEAEIIAPLDAEPEEAEKEEAPEAEAEAGDAGFDVDEIDEDSFDEFAESFLRENYKNIKGYKTTKIKDMGSYALAEGIVTLAGGKSRMTQFRIRPSKFNRSGKGSCLVENIQLKKRTVARTQAR